jgi:glycosyltransferase involved in cell wall biosynthesis
MRIAINDYAGFSFPLELSRELSRRGHHILHLYSGTSGGPTVSVHQNYDERLRIANLDVGSVDKDNFWKRWKQERRYGDLAIRKLSNWRPDLIISANTPLESQKKIICWAGRHFIPSIFWLQDLLSIAAKSIISKVNRVLGGLAYRYMNRIEIDALARADHIISITDDFYPYLNTWNIDPAKVSLIPNWGPIEQIPVLPRKNPFSARYGLNEKFVVLYAGTLGKKQNIGLIPDSAARLIDDGDILFVVATDGRGHQLLDTRVAGKRYSNLLRLPLQPTEGYPYLLAASDVTLVTLDRSAGAYCVPSKLWSAYCAQKASVLAVDKQNLCARTTEQIGAGIVIPPRSVDQCVAGIKKLQKNSSLRLQMGMNARRYAECCFPISSVADKFEAVIDRVSFH